MRDSQEDMFSFVDFSGALPFLSFLPSRSSPSGSLSASVAGFVDLRGGE